MEPVIRQESRVAEVASWVTLVASFLLSFTTWWALGGVAGYDVVLANGHTIYLSWALALCVDGYIVTALVTWLSPVSERVARFARWNMYGAAGIGVVAQSAFHAASVWEATHVEWKASLAGVVGALPPLFAALAVHLRGMVVHDSRPAVAGDQEPTTPHVSAALSVVGDPAPVVTPVLTPPPPAPRPVPPVFRPAVASTPHPTPAPTPVDVTPEPVVTPAPRKRRTPQTEITPELLARVRKLRDERARATPPQPTGRRVVVDALGLSDGLARKVLAELSAAPQLRATGTD